jgi:membrane-bound lytic murein transglycosylase D
MHFRLLLSLLAAAALAACARAPDIKPDASAAGAPATIQGTATEAGDESVALPSVPIQEIAPALPSSKQAAPLVTRADALAPNTGHTASDGIPIGGYADLWDRIVAGYALAPLDSANVGIFERWFANNPEYMSRMMDRAQLYLYYIVEEVEKRGMPMEIALLPAIESAYKPHAYSRARAVGLWQFIPSTGRLYGLKMNWWYDGRRDVIASTQAALDYLQKLHDDFGDWHLAIAAYNCGEGNVQKAIRRNQRLGKPTDFVHLRLPRETRSYVPQLMAMANIISDPAKYGLQIASIPNQEYFAQVEIDSPVDLGVAAKLLDMPAEDLYFINPGYRQWLTQGDGPHTILVPADKKDTLLQGLSELEDHERVIMAEHTVRKGEPIRNIARRYGVTVDAIVSENNLKSTLLAAGQTLVIPISQARLAYAPPEVVASVSSSKKVRVTHRVRRGETLFSIAKRYGVAVRQLRQWNSLGVSSVLRAGQRLHIYSRKRHRASSDGEFVG